MKLQELCTYLESLAPLAYQEPYDNSGLLFGNPDTTIRGAVISLDCTEEVVDEAIKKGCNLVISHHPLVFKGLKRFTGSSYVDRTLIKAIKNDVAIYAIHTNLDNVAAGVNKALADKIGLHNLRILALKSGILKKLVTLCPTQHADAVRAALFNAGAGQIGHYAQCSFNVAGEGTFTPQEGANPFVGSIGIPQTEAELRIEVLYPEHLEKTVLSALKAAHPYEEVAYFLQTLSNSHQEIGSGMIGELPESQDALAVLHHIKSQLGVPVIRHTQLLEKKIKKIAICGGSGSFLLPNALAAGADMFVTADYKYHEFFDADKQLIIADVGHFESEQFTQMLLFETITKNFPNFALHLTEQVTNPIKYLI
ncbi:MAG: Nif3-like dinuclear metal center hexameric protein [Sphingobacteriaceae bacterium]|nr:Nif3-like dinuclear metal center hexameric protein [Sphingobacteriaceae bacterium]